MKRWSLLKLSFLVAALGVGWCGGSALAQDRPSPAGRPNFLLIYTDDQRWDALSVVQQEMGEKGRFPWFQTPNMDRLAKQGVRFRNAFVVNSLCSPSRACFLTGQYSHANGVVNNHSPFPADRVTHASMLKEAGYVTAYFGKWHHGNQKDRPGFDEVASFIGQGQFWDCPMMVNGVRTETKGWVDDVTTDAAVRFIKSRKSADKPFDMVVGFKSPHSPRIPADRAKTRFSGETLRPVPNLGLNPPFSLPKKATSTTTPAKPQWNLNIDTILNHFRCVSSVDDCLGRILDTLDETGLAENTVVLLTSDNGYFFGEHGLGDKRWAYEESIRIPMIVRWPGHFQAGEVRDEMVLNIDWAPTVVDLAGLTPPKEMQGNSWRPLMAGKGEGWRTSFFYEYFFENSFAIPTNTAVRTTNAKLIKYPGHDEWTELFDLKADPYETKNLANDPSGKELLGTMEREYVNAAEAVKYKVPEHADKPK